MKLLSTPALALAAAAAFSITASGVAQASDAEQEQVAANFMVADADGDGALTFAEFKTLIDLNAQHSIGRAKLVQRFNRYEMAFGRVDADGDGVATSDELANMAASAQ